MTAIRREIDAVDAELIKLLAARQKLIERAIVVKTEEGLPALIPDRVNEVISHAVNRAPSYDLHPELAKILWTEMVNWFVNYEEQALADQSKLAKKTG